MTGFLSIQTAFLLCEAIFCLLIAVTLFFMNKSMVGIERTFLSALVFLCGVLLLFDYFAYIYRGQVGQTAYVMVRISNCIVFMLSDLLLFLYTMYICRVMFGTYGLKSKVPCNIRVKIAYVISAVEVLLILISQFTGMYYYFDETNTYHRGSFYAITVAIPAVCFVICMSILIQYRKNVRLTLWYSMIAICLFPYIGMVLTTFFYGISFANIMIGFSFLILFFENIMSLNGEIDRAARTEQRTGIANEHALLEFLRSIDTEKRHEYACIFFDIKNFGEVNRKYGIQVGNLAITAYAQTLIAHLEENEILARQGSDKFMAVIEKKNLEDFISLLELTEFEVDADKTYTLSLTAVAGVYEMCETDDTPEDVAYKAITAFTHATEVTRTKLEYYNDSMTRVNDETRRIEELIPKALNDEEFLVYYQPKVNSSTKRLCGAEALVRWLHEGELISPGRFIPVLEKNDGMCDLDFYMLKHVCQDMEKWIKKGLVPPTVSVNFSRRGLSNPNLASDINNIVQSYHVPKKMIEIEITETIDEFPISVLKDFIDALHRFGYTVAVDDFGCGSSSLSLLREVTFDTLKIDKGFVDRAYAKDLTILSYIIKLAKAINVEVLAEGVEHKEQVETLSSLGCDIIQGYYYDKPLPKEVFENRIKTIVYE